MKLKMTVLYLRDFSDQEELLQPQGFCLLCSFISEGEFLRSASAQFNFTHRACAAPCCLVDVVQRSRTQAPAKVE